MQKQLSENRFVQNRRNACAPPPTPPLLSKRTQTKSAAAASNATTAAAMPPHRAGLATVGAAAPARITTLLLLLDVGDPDGDGVDERLTESDGQGVGGVKMPSCKGGACRWHGASRSRAHTGSLTTTVPFQHGGGAGDGVAEGVACCEADEVRDGVAVPVSVRCCEGLSEAVRDGVRVLLRVTDGDAEDDLVSASDGDPDSVDDTDGVRDCVRV